MCSKSTVYSGLPWWFNGKESTCQCRRCRFHPWARKIPRRRKWQPTPVFLSGKYHGQRSWVDYSLRGCKRVRYDLGTKEQVHYTNILSMVAHYLGKKHYHRGQTKAIFQMFIFIIFNFRANLLLKLIRLLMFS